jgi:hypothetical protein
LGEVQLLGPILVGALLLLHLSRLLLTETHLLVEALSVLRSALLLRLSPLALHISREDGRPCRCSHLSGRRRWCSRPGGRRRWCSRPGRRRLLNALALGCRLSGWPSGCFSLNARLRLSRLVLGGRLRVRRGSRFFRLAGRRLDGLVLLPGFGGCR